MPELKDTWNIQELYKDEDAWQADLRKAEHLLDELASTENTLLNSPTTLYHALEKNDALSQLVERLVVFAKMQFDQNMSDSLAKSMYETGENFLITLGSKLAFFTPELMKMDLIMWESFCQKEPSLSLYDFSIRNLLEDKEHILNTSEEKILTKLQGLGSSFSKIYDDLTVNDFTFPTIKSPENEEIIADNTNYMRALLHPNRNYRKEFFEGLLGTYQKHKNTLASIYYGSVKSDVYEAQLRGYSSSLARALQQDRIDEQVYTNLLQTVEEEKYHLENYLRYRADQLGIETCHFYDLFVPLAKDFNVTFSFQEAEQLVLDAVSPLGSDYVNTLKEAFANRWIDKYPRPNKDTGAYAIHTYGHHPYSLMNFTGTLNDVFTIAHELGHVMHSYYSMKHQPYVYSDYSIFTAEVASTVNEELLFHHLMKTSTNDEMKLYLLSNQLDGLRSTLYRQTLFADFEWQAHKKVESGEALLPTTLESIYKDCYLRYHGNRLVIEDVLLAEWSRIPHFYRAYYVYQYATGISAAVALSQGILEKKEHALTNYLTFLSSGGSDYPIEILKKAGVDMTAPTPIKSATTYFGKLLNELQALAQ